MTTLFDLRTGSLFEGKVRGPLDLENDADVAELEGLKEAQAVRLKLPTFKDGRAFSQLRLLRQRLGFEGLVVIGGHVLPDQALALKRLGADLVELEDERRARDVRRALSAYRHAYQRPALGEPVHRLREAAR